jgi:hypothetical protein
MEYNLSYLEKGRQPQFLRKWKTTSKKIVQPKALESKNNNIFLKFRTPIDIFLRKKDDLKKLKPKTIQS